MKLTQIEFTYPRDWLTKKPKTEKVWKCECEDLPYHLHRYKHPELQNHVRPIRGSAEAQVGDWNRYAKTKFDAKERERRRCECGQVVPKKAHFCPNCGRKV